MDFKSFLKTYKTSKKENITFCFVANAEEGVAAAKEVLYKVTDDTTVLFLSGGKTPKDLYEMCAKEQKLKVGAVGIVDERFGEPFHEDSNEKMIRETGLLDYLKSKNIPFHLVLQNAKERIDVASDYEKAVEQLFEKFKRRVAILGMGGDGHTASLPAGIQNSKFKSPSNSAGRQNLVEDYDNFPAEQKERISLTFKALEQMDLLLVLVFGGEKKKALEMMFAAGTEEEIPARFFKRPDITAKTLFITDQNV